jgi:L-asparaginase II
VKALQALPLVESGAADAFTDAELALACASHSGEPEHVTTALRILSRAGRDGSALRCGAHAPIHQPSFAALARAGQAPTALHNNCSGKHAGFVCLACALGVEPRPYLEPAAPVQREVKAAIEAMSGCRIDGGAVDGCSAPTWPVPLKHLAHAFARLGTGTGVSPARAKAAARLRAACAAQPWHVAGTGRFCTEIMRLLGERAFVKTGAEGVFCASLPGRGLGVALKCDDGATRAAEVTMAALIARFVDMSDAEHVALDRFVRPTMRNWNGIEVGSLRPATSLDFR